MLNIVSRTLSVHKEHEFLAKLETVGLGDAEAQMVIESKGNELAQRVVSFIRHGGSKPTASQKRSQEIMGSNYLGIEEAVQHLKIKPTKADLGALEEVPFSEVALEECKDTHMLVADFGLSIFNVQNRVDRSLFHDWDAWENNPSFPKKTGKVKWHLIRKDIVPNSTNKTWRDQQALLLNNEETPKARVIAYAIILYYLTTGKILFEGIRVRCPDVATRFGDLVNVNDFCPPRGLSFGISFTDECSPSLGLASARKF